MRELIGYWLPAPVESNGSGCVVFLHPYKVLGQLGQDLVMVACDCLVNFHDFGNT
jgi:hypothetical protein